MNKERRMKKQKIMKRGMLRRAVRNQDRKIEKGKKEKERGQKDRKKIKNERKEERSNILLFLGLGKYEIKM